MNEPQVKYVMKGGKRMGKPILTLDGPSTCPVFRNDNKRYRTKGRKWSWSRPPEERRETPGVWGRSYPVLTYFLLCAHGTMCIIDLSGSFCPRHMYSSTEVRCSFGRHTFSRGLEFILDERFIVELYRPSKPKPYSSTQDIMYLIKEDLWHKN